MLIDELVREQFGLDYMAEDLDVLNKLRGKKLACNSFYVDVGKGFNGHAAAYFLTRYFLPVADLAELTVGIHMLPLYINQKRFVIAQFDSESERLMDHAYSMRTYVRREIFNAQAEDDITDEDLSTVGDVFGEDFYQTTRDLLPDNFETFMIEVYGGAAADYQSLVSIAGLRGEFEKRVDWLKRGAEAIPECMYFHRELAKWYAGQGESVLAAQSFARSLRCYHHTAYGRCSEEYYELGRESLEKVPSAFSDLARTDLMVADGEARMEWIVSLFEAGEVDTSVKLLSDFRYDSRTDLHPVLFEFLRRHYDVLGWRWASRWCDLCTVDEKYESRQYWYRGRLLSEGWENSVKRFLGAQ